MLCLGSNSLHHNLKSVPRNKARVIALLTYVLPYLCFIPCPARAPCFLSEGVSLMAPLGNAGPGPIS